MTLSAADIAILCHVTPLKTSPDKATILHNMTLLTHTRQKHNFYNIHHGLITASQLITCQLGTIGHLI